MDGKVQRKDFWMIWVVLGLSIVAGCARVPPQLPQVPPSGVKEEEKTGVYHKVRSGHTLWKIAKTYGVSLEDIILSNNIPDVARIEENQLVFIPGATSIQEIPVSKELIAGEFVWPLKGQIVSYFKSLNGRRLNQGIDISAKEGEAVMASANGTVVFADYLNGYANTIILEHVGGYRTVYAQNSLLLVKNGDVVKKGSPIARVGRKGRLAFLHFEVRKNSTADNPLYYLP